MKTSIIFLSCCLTVSCLCYGQAMIPDAKQKQAFEKLINTYSEAREKRDTSLLRNILTPEIDQLVSSGEWRNGIDASIQGMLNSSAGSPGTRTLTVDKMRMVGPNTALVDCRYEIGMPNGNPRRMWSTFILVSTREGWRISAIRNMLPSGQ